MSFTIPIELPPKGAGLFVWDAGPESSPIGSPYDYVPYELGQIVIHDGLQFHMMETSRIKKGQYRITMQGHGVLSDNVWNLFG